MNKLLKLSINKDIFEKIVSKNINFIEKAKSGNLKRYYNVKRSAKLGS